MVMENFLLRYGGTYLYFGLNTINSLKHFIRKHSLVGVITGRRSAKLCGALDDLVKLLVETGVDYRVYDLVEPNPWVSIVDRIACIAKDDSVEAFIAIGGGSVIDVAKVVSVVVANGGSPLDYLYFYRRPSSMLPLYVINTTHGTGSEIDRYAVLTVDSTGEKRGISIRYPDASVDDPRYTATLPRNQTLYTVFDSFYHSYESTTSTHSTPFNKLLSREAVSLIKQWLPKTLDNPGDLEARYWLLYSSMLAGVSIDIAGTHIVHAIEHALSGLEPKLAHGAGLAIVGPYTIEYIHKACPEKSALILKQLDPSIKPFSGYYKDAMEAIKAFQEEHGFGERLGDYGFTVKEVDQAIDLLFNKLDYLMNGTPFTVSKEVVRSILLNSL